MSATLKSMPELRVIFEADAGALLNRATEQLAALNQPEPDFAMIAQLRNSIHSLRGAAAMVGAKVLSLMVDDYERLLEVADSFKLTAPEKVREVCSFLQNQLQQLRSVVQQTLQDRGEEARACFDLVHGAVLASWGGYFYSPPKEEEEVSRHEPAVRKPIHKTIRPSQKAAADASRQTNAKAIAQEFRSSLGVAGPAQPATPAAASEPATPGEQVDPEMMSYFVLETSESLSQIDALLLAWEKTPGDAKTAQSIFRLVHTVKGAANSLGLVRIGRLLHGLEDLLETHVVDCVFSRLDELIQVIFDSSDTIRALVRETQTGISDASLTGRIANISQRLQALASLPPVPAKVGEPEAAIRAVEPAPATMPLAAEPLPQPIIPPAVPEDQVSPETVLPITAEVGEALTPASAAPVSPSSKTEGLDNQTIRVDPERLDLLMNLIGELVISRSRLEKKLTDISRLKEEMFFGKSRLFQAITDFQGKYEYSNATGDRRGGMGNGQNLIGPGSHGRRTVVPTGAGDDLHGFSELEFDQYDDFNILARTLMEIGTDTSEIFSQLNHFFDAFGEETGQFSKITARLQDEITRVRMMPLTLLFQRLQRSARDAARKEGKDIKFGSIDNDARLDKLILDQLYTPLLHLVRNAVSHGIESEEARRAAGKSPTGNVTLRALCEANQVVIEVNDDGGGLNLAAIRATAIERGLLSAGASTEDDALVQMIFLPGFSTAARVTEVSGRGVGLDVVRREIARLSGTIHVRSTPGVGCTFVIHLPLTLAINQAVFITAGDESCALPLNFVERIQEIQAGDVTLSGQRELVRTPEGMVPLLRLHRLLNLPVNGQAGGAMVLARVADRRVAIGVDRILRKQDIVVKPLGPLLRGHELFSGATIAGDGQVVMILDLPRILQGERSSSASATTDDGAPVPEPARSGKPTILVVDDSLSVRKVIEKHLLSLHYTVELAVDGLDALDKLRLRPVSLVLTDLEMPRMHGFELIAEMRRQDATRAIPIIVITSRDAEKHRRRATALGADDYIIKPLSRDQLATGITRLLGATRHPQ